MENENNRPLNDNSSEAGKEQENKSYRPRFTRVDGERPQRPRFNREGSAPRYQRVERPQRSYDNDGEQREGGYRPNNEGGYRPRYSSDRPQRPYHNDRYQQNADGEQREGGYRPNNEGGYRPRYNSERPQRPYHNDRYQQNADGEQREGGYRPRYNSERPQRPYGDRPQRPYQPRYEQGNTWENGSDRPQRFNNFDGDNYGNRRPNFRKPGGKKPYTSTTKYAKKKQILYTEEINDPNEELRLNKYLANAGICSRREADEFITAGVVTVNGQVATELGTRVKRGDEVRFHDQLVNIERKIYLILNKPKDCVTTVEDPQERHTVMEYVKGACKERIYPVGRLDRNTTGVLLFTNDGELATKLTHPSYMKKKVYHARLDKPISEEDLQKLLDGIELEDGAIRVDAISYADKDTDHTQVGVEIHSGRNRIVRRMFEAIGYHVVRLDRTQFAGLTKKNLKRGDWRFLTEREVNTLRMGSYE